MNSVVAAVLAVLVWTVGLSAKAVELTSDQLRLVQILWRHGDRSPCHLIPNDPHNGLSSWPQGLCELTPAGMKQHFLLGQWLRKRYAGFISEDYQQREIYVRSTENNRTIQSAMANMAGFYFPPIKNQTFNQTLPWFPFPVHSTIDQTDAALNQDAPCEKSKLYFAEMLANPSFLRLLADNEKLLTYVLEKAGYPIMNSYDVVTTLYDTLLAEHDHPEDHTWPSWINQTIFQQLHHLYDNVIHFLFLKPEWQRLRGGVLYGDMVHMMQQKANKNWTTLSPDLKMYMYSAHDTTILALLQCMGAFNNISPPYASAVMVELYESADDYFVEVYYQNTTAHNTANLPPPQRVKIANCSQPCPLNDLIKLSAPVIPTDWKKECKCDVPLICNNDATKYTVYDHSGTRFEKKRNNIPESDLTVLRKYLSDTEIASLNAHKMTINAKL